MLSTKSSLFVTQATPSHPFFIMDSKDMETGGHLPTTKGAAISDTASVTQVSEDHVGRNVLADVIPPHDSYEGRHRFDPTATWTPAEERRVLRKTDLYLLTWLCFMFFGLQLDRGNNSNATADNLLADLGMTSDDYNNGMYNESFRPTFFFCFGKRLTRAGLVKAPRSNCWPSCPPSSLSSCSSSATVSASSCPS